MRTRSSKYRYLNYVFYEQFPTQYDYILALEIIEIDSNKF